MSGKSSHLVPLLASVIRTEQGARIRSAPRHLGTGFPIWNKAPDTIEIYSSIFGETNSVARFDPRLAVIFACMKVGAPPRTGHGAPELAGARISAQVIDLASGKKRTIDAPALTPRIAFEYESALTRTYIESELRSFCFGHAPLPFN
jgi:hypothetical protein